MGMGMLPLGRCCRGSNQTSWTSALQSLLVEVEAEDTLGLRVPLIPVKMYDEVILLSQPLSHHPELEEFSRFLI